MNTQKEERERETCVLYLWIVLVWWPIQSDAAPLYPPFFLSSFRSLKKREKRKWKIISLFLLPLLLLATSSSSSFTRVTWGLFLKAKEEDDEDKRNTFLKSHSRLQGSLDTILFSTNERKKEINLGAASAQQQAAERERERDLLLEFDVRDRKIKTGTPFGTCV